MKNLIYLLLFGLVATVTHAQQSPIIDFMDEMAMKDTSATSIQLGPELSSMVTGNQSKNEDGEMSDLFRDFKGMRILVIEKGHDEAFKKFESMLSLNDYLDLMSVRDGGDYVRFVARASEGGATYSEVAMIVHDESEFVLMSFLGTIEKGDIGKLSKAFDINLENMEEMQKEQKE